jgi:two-component system chemotaxis response regulator CheY
VVVRGLVRFALEEAGFLVDEAADGFGALVLLDHLPETACLITDLNMPGMDGVALLRALRARERTRHLPAIMLTTDDHSEVRELALRAGATAFFTKPFVAEQLVRAIQLAIT